MDFLRIDPRMDEHPDIEAAGFDGARVFEAVLRATARNDGRGRLRGKFASPAWLARRMNLKADVIGGQDPDVWVARGLSRCVDCGLLDRDGEDVTIPGWEKFYSPAKPEALRSKEYRDRQKETAESDRHEASRGVTTVTEAVIRHATPLHTTTQNTEEALERASKPPPEVQPEPLAPQVLDVYAYYRQTFNRRQEEPTAAERDVIRGRLLDEYSPEDLKRAVTGLSNSKFHRKRGHLALRYALGDRDSVERCMGWAEHPPDPEPDTGRPQGRADPNDGIIGGVPEGAVCMDCKQRAEFRFWDEWLCYPCHAKRAQAWDQTQEGM